MIANIPEPILTLLKEIGAVGGEGTYLVGGFVRDLLLNRPSLDIDVVVENDALHLAAQMRDRWDGHLAVHKQFGTATLTLKDPALPTMDFVTARRETYTASGTLPMVEPGTLAEDLRRRDFSINALALRLDTHRFGTIVDVTGGLDDLETGTVRTLHERSFTDDPTRIFRAARYAERYNFAIPETDTEQIAAALPVLATLSGQRLRNEIDKILLEENAPSIVTRLTDYHVWETIDERWEMSQNFAADLQKAEQAIRWAKTELNGSDFSPKRLRWMALFGAEMPSFQIHALVSRLVVEHSLYRIAGRGILHRLVPHRQVTLEPPTHRVLEAIGRPVADSARISEHNGRWCVLDSENEKTYICNVGSLYRILTPLTTYRELTQTLNTLSETAKPSESYHILEEFPLETIALCHVDDTLPEWKRKKIADYLYVQRKTTPFITGKDLMRIRLQPGPEFQNRLRIFFNEQLDGEIKTEEEAADRLWCFADTIPARPYIDMKASELLEKR